MTENYKFCLSSDLQTIHSISLPSSSSSSLNDEITWNNLTDIIKEKLKMSKITYFELYNNENNKVGDRIHDIDDFLYALKCYENNTMYFKVFGRLEISNNITITKKSNKQLKLSSDSIDSLISSNTPSSTYDPLDDFQLNNNNNNKNNNNNNNSTIIRKTSSSSSTQKDFDSILTPPTNNTPTSILSPKFETTNSFKSTPISLSTSTSTSSTLTTPLVISKKSRQSSTDYSKTYSELSSKKSTQDDKIESEKITYTNYYNQVSENNTTDSINLDSIQIEEKEDSQVPTNMNTIQYQEDENESDYDNKNKEEVINQIEQIEQNERVDDEQDEEEQEEVEQEKEQEKEVEEEEVEPIVEQEEEQSENNYENNDINQNDGDEDNNDNNSDEDRENEEQEEEEEEKKYVEDNYIETESFSTSPQDEATNDSLTIDNEVNSYTNSNSYQNYQNNNYSHVIETKTSYVPNSINEETASDEITLDSLADRLNLDFSSSLQSIVAGLSRLEETIESSPSLSSLSISSSITAPISGLVSGSSTSSKLLPQISSNSLITSSSSPLSPSSSSSLLVPKSSIETYLHEFDPNNPSRPNMASLKTSAELEAERLEEEAKENARKAKIEEEKRKLREIMELERKAVLEQEKLQKNQIENNKTKSPKKETKKDIESTSIQQEKINKLDNNDNNNNNNDKKKNEKISNIQFALFNDLTNSKVLNVVDQSEWSVIINKISESFDIEPTSITHVILLDEDDDEVSGKLNDHIKFWKFYDKYSTSIGRHFSVYYDINIPKKSNKPVIEQVLPEIEFEKSVKTQKSSVSLYSRRNHEATPKIIDTTNSVNNTVTISKNNKNNDNNNKNNNNSTTSSSSSPISTKSKTTNNNNNNDTNDKTVINVIDTKINDEIELDFRLSTDYVDEKNTITIQKNISWNNLNQILLDNLINITPTQKLTSSVSKLSLYDDEGDELVGNIENEDSFWKVVNSRYRKNRTIFVVTLITTINVIKEKQTTTTSITPTQVLKTTTTTTINNNNSNNNNSDNNNVIINCRLVDQNKSTPISFPLNSEWEQINQIICTELKLVNKQVTSISLFDDDNDELFSGITDAKKFWKCYKSHYKKNYTDIVCTVTNILPVITSPKLSKNVVPISSPTSKLLEIPVKFRLLEDNNENNIVIISIPQNLSWNELSLLLLEKFNKNSLEYELFTLELIDNDGDTYGTFSQDQKFWKSIQTTYKKGSNLVYLITLKELPPPPLPTPSSISSSKVTPSQSPKVIQNINTIPLNFKLKNEDLNTITCINIPENSNWNDITQSINQHYNFDSKSTLNLIELIDEDEDDLVGQILNEKKFWKVVKTGYTDDTIFVISMNIIQQKQLQKNINKIPLYFRLQNEDLSTITCINIPENGTWNDITQLINQHYNFPDTTILLHLDLLDEEGDEVTIDIDNDIKLWKILKKNKMTNTHFLISYKFSHHNNNYEQNHDDDEDEVDNEVQNINNESEIEIDAEVEVEESDIIPLYFRLSTDSLTDKGVIEIPHEDNWNDILVILYDFFDINPETQKIECINLVDDEGDEIFSNIQNEQKFWKVVDTKYNFEYMVFVVIIHDIIPKLTFSFKYLNSVKNIDIIQNCNWEVICQVISDNFSIPSNSIQEINLIDIDEDEIFSKINDDRKFWKAALSKYTPNENSFLIQLNKQTSTPNTITTSSSSRNNNNNNNNNQPQQQLQQQSQPIIIKKTKPQEPSIKSLSSSSSSSLSSLSSHSKQPTSSTKNTTNSLNSNSNSISTTVTSTSTSTSISTNLTKNPPVMIPPDVSKFEGRYVGLSFKLSSDSFDDQILISIPAMGSWEQICQAIISEYVDENIQQIDRLELLNEDEDIILNNIVSSSKFWKVCLEQYKENETIFNIILENDKKQKKLTTNKKLNNNSNNSNSNNKKIINNNNNNNNKIDSNSIELFFNYCGDGNYDAVLEMIENGIDIDIKDSNGLTALHISSIRGQLDIIKLLIENNSDVTICDNDGMTPLHYACEVNYINVIKYLILNGGDILSRNHMGLTCLHYICINGNIELSYLINSTNINIATNSGLTLLHFSADMGHDKMILHLLNNHANYHLRDDEGLIPLHLACINNHLKCVKLLIEYGSYWNIRDDNGMSPLLYSCKEGNIEIVKYLMNTIENIHILARNDEGNSCVHLAGESGSLELLQYLIINKKMNINLRNNKNETVLHIVQKLESNEHLVEWLEENGATTRNETDDEKLLRKQIDKKGEKALRAFEMEELSNLENR